MFTDMVGYSALTQADEARALEVLGRHNRLLRPIFTKYRGREVKTVGDAFLVEFESALEAAQCAVEIQRLLHEYNLSSPAEWKIHIRIGIHVGDVVEERNDVLGDAVNVASRIEPLAEPGGICVSQQTYDQILNKIPEAFVRLPEAHLKNIRTPVGVYKVVQPWDPAPALAATSALSGGHHLAVLPLANISPDPNDEYFADGLTEELISVLSQVRGLSVIARTSVTPYKTAPKSVAQVGAELGVDTVIEGSVRKSGKRIRISLQLVDVSTQRHIWASSYNREIDDVFSVQSDIAERTAQALELELMQGARAAVARPPTTNPEAYEQYLHGLVAARRPEGAGLEDAVRSFEAATRLDPKFAAAFAMWADYYVYLAGDYLPMADVMPRARELASRAVELDPDSTEAHAALANIAMQFDHDWPRAEAEFRRAIELNPSNVEAHRFFGLMMLAQERFPEAVELFRRVIQLDPGRGFEGMLGWALVEAGDFDRAFPILLGMFPQGPKTVGEHASLGLMFLQAGRIAEADREARTPVEGATPTEAFDLALVNAMVGRTDPARALLASSGAPSGSAYISPTNRAMLHAALGEKEPALELLETAYRDGDRVLWLYYRGAMFDSLRDEPRFQALLRKYRVPVGTIHRRTERTGPPPGPAGS